MPGSSTTQSMKKTIGHRGVETTTGETTYKKVRPGLGWRGGGLLTLTAEVKSVQALMFVVCSVKLVWEVPLTGHPKIVGNHRVKWCVFRTLILSVPVRPL